MSVTPAPPPSATPTTTGLLRRLAIGAILLGLGFVPGYVLGRPSPSPKEAPNETNEVRENNGRHAFINPLLECNLGEEVIGSSKPKPSKSALMKLIDEKKNAGDVSIVSLYFRDLNNGPTVGINQEERFLPGSLLKVPIMMHYLKLAETDPALLQQSVNVVIQNASASQIEQHFQPSQRIDDGVYPIEELIKRSIIYSDNDAASALTGLPSGERLPEIFNDLGIEPIGDRRTYRLTTKDYAGFFRVLFNASYLTDSLSEQALELLTRTEFDKGLTAKLPPDVLVAHKFGERWADESAERQLHDCGIVYYPNHPYLLCIMTRGTDMDRLANAVADISKNIYDQIKAQTDAR